MSLATATSFDEARKKKKKKEQDGRMGANYTPTRIGHRPWCALSAQARFADFPRQERLNALRPHLIRNELFPARSDPSTAPITMRELKGLVRLWKMHSERNFWRDNATKDKIVLALHAHLENRRKLEKYKQEIVAKGRQKREDKAVLRQNVCTSPVSPGSPLSPVTTDFTTACDSPSRRKTIPQKELLELPEVQSPQGNKNTTAEYIPVHEREPQAPTDWKEDARMIKQSRVAGGTLRHIDPRKNSDRADNSHQNKQAQASGTDDDLPSKSCGKIISPKKCPHNDDLAHHQFLPVATSPGPKSSLQNEVSLFTALSTNEHLTQETQNDTQELLIKRKCSTALLNMSTNEVMQSQFIEQGGLKALLDLAISSADLDIATNCAACLSNLIAFGDYYEPTKLVDAGVVRVLCKLCLQSGTPLVRHLCALCLCRLSAEPRLEERLIAQGTLVAATKLVHISDHYLTTKIIATKTLVNLTVTLDGNQAETLVKNVLKSVAQLSATASSSNPEGGRDASTQQFCAQVLASLTCLSIARPILAKQGVVAIIRIMLTSSLSKETTDACAAALCNMGQLHGCRKEMLALGLIRLMCTMLRSGTSETKEMCTMCLTGLSFQRDLRSALLREGALRTIAALVVSRADPELTQRSASALLNFAYDAQTREEVVSEDGLPALAALLDPEGNSVDEATRANALMALCNLLADQATCPQVLEFGLLPKLVTFIDSLGRFHSLFEHLSIALLNLSIHSDLRKTVANTEGSCKLLLELATYDQRLEKEAEQNVDPNANERNSIPSAEVVSASASKHLATTRNKNADATTSNVSQLPARMRPNTKGGTNIDHNADPDHSIKALKALINLSMEHDAHDAIVALDLVSGLRLLNRIHDTPQIPSKKVAVAEPQRPGTRRRKSHSQQQVQKESKALVRNYDCTGCLHLSAMLLHALSTRKENHATLIEAGTVSLLVKLAQSPNEKTKTVVAGSLYNLTQCTPVTNEEFLNTLMALSHCNENARILWCAYCFSNVSTYPKGRATLGKLAGRVIPTLLAMMRSGCADAERIQYHCSVAMCNTLSVFLPKDDVISMIDDGTIQDIIVITVLRANDVQTKQVLAQALFNLFTREDTRPLLIKQDVPLAMIRLTSVDDQILNLLCVKMLFNLSCEGEKHASKLLEMKVIKIMIDQCLSPILGGSQIKRLSAKTISNLARVSIILSKGISLPESNIVAGVRAMAVVREQETLEHVSSILFCMSQSVEGREALLRQGGVSVLVLLCTGPPGVTNCVTPGIVKQIVIATIQNISCDHHFFNAITEHALTLLINTIQDSVQTLETRLNACRTLCNLITYHIPSREAAIMVSILPALRIFARIVDNSEDAMIMLARILRDLTQFKGGVTMLASQSAMALCARLAKEENVIIKHDVATAVCNLCSSTIAPKLLIEEGAVNALFWLTLQDCLNLSRPIYRESAIAIRYMSQHAALLPLICMEDNLLPLLVRLAKFTECEETRYHTAVAMYYILGHEKSQRSLCRIGAIKVLSDLAATGDRIRDVCSAALHQLPNELLGNVDGQLLSVLMSLLKLADGAFTDPSLFKPDRSLASTHEWTSISTNYELRSTCTKSEWPTSVIGKSTTTFCAAQYDLESYPGEQVNPSRARGSTEIIGEFTKLRHSTTQFTTNNVHLALVDRVTPVKSDDSTTDVSIALDDTEPPTPTALKRHKEAHDEPAVNQDPDKAHRAAPSKEDDPFYGQTKANVEDSIVHVLPDIRESPAATYLSRPALQASDDLEKCNIASAFKSPPRIRTSSDTDMEGNYEASGSSKKKIARRTRARSKKVMVKVLKSSASQHTKQQDRIADDYFEILRHL